MSNGKKKQSQPSMFHPTNCAGWKWWQCFKKRHADISL